jgi:hypothetical protein
MKEKAASKVRNDTKAQENSIAHHFVSLGEALHALEGQHILTRAVPALVIETGGIILTVIVVVVVKVVLLIVVVLRGSSRGESSVEGLDI